MATGTSKIPILIVPTTLPGPPAIPTVLTSPSVAVAGPGGYNYCLIYFYLTVKFTPYPCALGWQLVLFPGESLHFLSGDTGKYHATYSWWVGGGGLVGSIFFWVCVTGLSEPLLHYCALCGQL